MLDNLPKIHERERVTQEARCEIEGMCLKAREKYSLTDVEWLQILSSMSQSTLKYMLRYERHGNYDSPAGVE